MKKIGIICEYNPFHNGHIYHIDQIKKKYPDSIIILILNGYFLERGEISLLSKYDKTSIALNHNVDIVLELPTIFGTQSADTFATKSIEILNHFKIDMIIFGSESANIEKLDDIASRQLNTDFDQKIKEYLDEGLNYPTALSRACNSDIINPNDLLGISYIKAIKKINPSIQYETIKRTNNYHDIQSDDSIISASNIRNKINNNKDITSYLPIDSKDALRILDKDLLFNLIKYKIETCDNLELFLDVDEGIENRLKKQLEKANNLEEYIELIKTKRYTYNKINRMLLHILLSFRKDENIVNLEYIKILGFNSKGQEYISTIRKDIDVPIAEDKNSQTYKLEHKAVILYDLLMHSNEKKIETRNKPIIKI